VFEMYLSANKTYRCNALGMATHYKDAKIYFYRHESLPLPLTYFQDEAGELISTLSTNLAIAEQVRGKLWGAVHTLALFLVSPLNELQNAAQPDPGSLEKLLNNWDAERFYWQKLELPFKQLLQDLPHESEASLAWYQTLRQTAWDALERTIGFAGTDAAALKAAVRARSLLGAALKELLPDGE
jgi:hypothetical protein